VLYFLGSYLNIKKKTSLYDLQNNGHYMDPNGCVTYLERGIRCFGVGRRYLLWWYWIAICMDAERFWIWEDLMLMICIVRIQIVEVAKCSLWLSDWAFGVWITQLSVSSSLTLPSCCQHISRCQLRHGHHSHSLGLAKLQGHFLLYPSWFWL